MKERFIMPEVGANRPLNGVGKESLSPNKPKTIIVSFGKPVKDAIGGLVTGVLPLAGAEGATWIYAGDQNGDGEHGGPEEVLRTDKGGSIRTIGVPLDKKVRKKVYEDYANDVLWPLLHGQTHRIKEHRNEPSNFESFKDVQGQFADEIAKNIEKGKEKDTFVLINDYHLPGAALKLREKGFKDAKLAFFLHTPFPKKESFMHLHHSEREYFLEGLLAHDFVGLQTKTSKENFINIAREVLNIPEEAIETVGNTTYITWKGRRVGIEYVPIGIDTKAFQEQGRKPNVLEKTRAIKEKYKDEFLYLFLGRRDYTKGIPQLLEAADMLLEKHPELIEKVRFLIAAPETRGGLAEYQLHSLIVENLVKEINKKYLEKTKGKWGPVVYMPEGLRGDDVYAHDGAANAVVGFSLADGQLLGFQEAMNVRKGQGEKSLTIISGEEVGAAQVYGNYPFLLVDVHKGRPGRDEDAPQKREDSADTLHKAYVMSEEEREERFEEELRISDEYTVWLWAKRMKDKTMAVAA